MLGTRPLLRARRTQKRLWKAISSATKVRKRESILKVKAAVRACHVCQLGACPEPTMLCRRQGCSLAFISSPRSTSARKVLRYFDLMLSSRCLLPHGEPLFSLLLDLALVFGAAALCLSTRLGCRGRAASMRASTVVWRDVCGLDVSRSRHDGYLLRRVRIATF